MLKVFYGCGIYAVDLVINMFLEEITSMENTGLW